ncbi:MAG: glycerate kinase [Clostridium sp.]|uniref:glycerate kinase family protein n=1 Tax=Clostridium sp. TaxID=1506 RepID=UPI00290D9444|nr:glycerate kinase [Clostridium sp.]MDU7148950.1 glycerate kinase [Clostridium sp.]MDU7242455.1 glycerate kinase [Clostridium sp.]
MKFILAPDSFKESMTSKDACNAMERGIKKVIKDAICIKVPMADGGEGTVEALVEATEGRFVSAVVTDPLGHRKIKATYGILGNGEKAIIEMASASGIHLVEGKNRNPLITTTYGTGELILDAINRGIKHIIIGIGGSATNDGGAGMIQALGAHLLDKEGKELNFGGSELIKLNTIDLTNFDKRLNDVIFEVACDVNNPLIGENGASRIFGPQKGATEDMIIQLDEALANYAEVIKRELGIDVANVEGAGAAGGVGAALLAFFNGRLKSGIELIIKHTDLENKIKEADFVFTGEGSIDRQTIFGKTPMGVASVAKKSGVKTIAFAGKIDEGSENLYDVGINSIFGIIRGVCSLEEALKNGEINLEKTVENVVRTLIL